MPAKKEENGGNNYSRCVHLSTAQQDVDTSQLSVSWGKKSWDTRSSIDVKLFLPAESCQNQLQIVNAAEESSCKNCLQPQSVTLTHFINADGFLWKSLTFLDAK